MAERAIAEYSGPVTLDRYGRRVPKPATGSIGLGDHTSSTTRICDAVDELFCRIVDHRLLVRRLNVVASDLQTVEQLVERNAAANYVQPDLFSDMQEVSNGSDSTIAVITSITTRGLPTLTICGLSMRFPNSMCSRRFLTSNASSAKTPSSKGWTCSLMPQVNSATGRLEVMQREFAANRPLR